MTQPPNQLVITERDEVSRGIRQLLATPLVAEHRLPEMFDLIRRRREPIRQWFDYYCGWTLTVEPRLGYARLIKVNAATDASRPARRLRPGHAPFDRRRYVLLCVAAAELLTLPVTTIGALAAQVAAATEADPVVERLDTTNRQERMAFVDALRLLESFGALAVVDGASEAFVDSPAATVRYRVDPTLLLRLPAAPVGPAQLGVPVEEVPLRFEDLLAEISREHRHGVATGRHEDTSGISESQRAKWVRHSVFRRVLDDPVVYLDDLTDEERLFVTSIAGRKLLRRAAEEGGFVLEERAEGLLLVDTDGIASDAWFPDDASPSTVAALLLLDELSGPTAPVGLTSAAAGLLARFPRWAKTYPGSAGPQRLAADAVATLLGFGLVRAGADGVVTPLPAAARYAAPPPSVPTTASSEEPQ
jgi:uncharacterized protein (TIGR02678 family)